MATLNGGEGNDRIIGTNSDDKISARAGNDYIDGKDGNDLISTGGGSCEVYGGLGNDKIYHTGDLIPDSFTKIYGGPGDDKIYTRMGVSIWAGSGADYIEAGPSDRPVNIFAQDGDDTVQLEHGLKDFDVSLGSGDDRLRIISYTPEVIAAPHTMEGGEGYDILELHRFKTESNVDTAIEFSGFEHLRLGEFYDGDRAEEARVSFSPSNFVGLKSFAIDMESWDTADIFYDLDLSNIKGTSFTIYNPCYNRGGHEVLGSKSKDFYYGYGSGSFQAEAGKPLYTNENLKSPDFFAGNEGDDYFDGGDGVDTAIYNGNHADYSIEEITYNTFTVTDNVGSDGKDTIVDVNRLRFADKTVEVVIRGMEIIGDETDDTLSGGSNSDLIDGAGGDDDLSGAGGNDTVNGDDGDDQVNGNSGDDFLNGGGGSDVLNGGSGDDTVDGGVGDDLIIGGHGAGNDIYRGGKGIDVAKYTSAKSGLLINLSASKNHAKSLKDGDAAGIGVDQLRGIENLIGGKYGDKLVGDSQSNSLQGKGGNDTLIGKGGQDKLFGQEGKDTLIGNNGKDVFIGGAGQDTMMAGKDKAKDTFIFNSTNDSGVGSKRRDKIDQFDRGEDVIDLSRIDANANAKGNQDFAFSNVKASNSIWVTDAGKNVSVKGDVNGDGKADFEILVMNLANLNASDFVL